MAARRAEGECLKRVTQVESKIGGVKVDELELTREVRSMILTELDMVGIAPSDRLAGAPEGRRPIDILPTARSVIVGAVHILDSVCDDLPYSRYEYTNQFFVLNALLNSVATKVARFLEEGGYRALPIPPAYPRINKEIAGILSHRHAAVAAGIGELGLNNLLITKRFGPRVRLVTIVTEAPLRPDEPYQGRLCEQWREKCGLACVKNCPTNALKADGTLNKTKCLHYQEQIMPWSAVELRCGLCVGSCPIGRRVFKETARPDLRSESVREKRALWTGAKW